MTRLRFAAVVSATGGVLFALCLFDSNTPDEKKSARIFFGGAVTDKCDQFLNGLAATYGTIKLLHWNLVGNEKSYTHTHTNGTYLIQSHDQCLWCIESCLLGNVCNDIVECFARCGAETFSPHQFVQKLLDNLAG